MKRCLIAAAMGAACTLAPLPAPAFCGFYVGKADASLFNKVSKVVMVRDENRTVISMLNDYRGELSEFALVVPVPQVLRREQINVGDRKLFDRIDAYSAPRLVEYFDPDPCAARLREEKMLRSDAARAAPAAAPASPRALGVTVEAQYTVGEYDIVILSAKESNGLETWLRQNGYRIPRGAAKALQPYLRQDMRFFVAKVNLTEQAKTGSATLRPLQFAFESEKFMLPIRLGMVNAAGPQDLVIYMLTRHGRVESTNYRTLKLPANMDVPAYLKAEFPRLYKALFDHQVQREGLRAVFTEYFWDMGWCDPCAADPLTPEELRAAGVFWLDRREPAIASEAPRIAPPRPLPGGTQPVMLTRLHVRYSPDTFPEDLMFQQTRDRQNFQARYVLRHAWAGDAGACPEARAYLDGVAQRQAREAEELARLTGWEIGAIRARMNLPAPVRRQWWEGLLQQSGLGR